MRLKEPDKKMIYVYHKGEKNCALDLEIKLGQQLQRVEPKKHKVNR